MNRPSQTSQQPTPPAKNDRLNQSQLQYDFGSPLEQTLQSTNPSTEKATLDILYPIPEPLATAIRRNHFADIQPKAEVLQFARAFFDGILSEEDIFFFWNSNLVVINQTYLSSLRVNTTDH